MAKISYKDLYKKMDKIVYDEVYEKSMIKEDPEFSRMSDTLRDLTSQITESVVSLNQEMVDLAGVSKELSSLLEGLEEIGSRVQHHKSILRKAAIRLETVRLSLPQSGRDRSESSSAGIGSPLPATDLAAEAEAPQFGLAPSPPDQG